MKVHAIQYTIRGVPLEVDKSLRERAKSRKVSINQVIIEELTRATIGLRQHADFSDLVGRWRPDDAFDDVVASQRQISQEDWH